MSLAENLRRIREGKKLSQASLAKLANVSQQSISRLESGVDLTSKKLPAIASALGCQLADLDETYRDVAPQIKTSPSIQTEPATEHEKLKAKLGEQFAAIMQADENFQRTAVDVIAGLLQVLPEKPRIKRTKEKSSPIRT